MLTSSSSNLQEKTTVSIGVELYHAIEQLDENRVKRILASEPLPAWEEIIPHPDALRDDYSSEQLLQKAANSNELIFDHLIDAYFSSFNDELIRALITLFVENNDHAALCEYLPYSVDALIDTHFQSLISIATNNKNLDILAALLEAIETDITKKNCASSAIKEVLLTTIQMQDIHFLNEILKKLPQTLIKQEIFSVLTNRRFYYQSEYDCIKVLLISFISDEYKISMLSTAIKLDLINLVQLILPNIITMTDRSLISIIGQARYHNDIYRLIKAHYKNELLQLLNTQLASTDLNDNIVDFSKMIFLPRQYAILYRAQWRGTLVSTIYNNDRYPTADEQLSQTKGHPLTLHLKHQSTPIGYTIKLPEGKITAVVIDIYGGFRKSDFEYLKQKLKELNDKSVEPEPNLDNRLYEEGVAIVYTNLCDLIELKVFQAQMSESLFRKIHRSIDCLYEILQDNPESLHPKLAPLKNLPFFLRGASFGGLMSVRYAQLAVQYPEQFRRFQGYLSFNGALSAQMLYNSDLPYLYEEDEPRDYRADFLNPFNHISFIEDPILVSHCLDDNNVNAKVAFDFVRKAHENGKEHLVRLQIVEHGNTMFNNFAHKESTKGHFAVDRFEFEAYSDAVLQFIKSPTSKIPEVSSWRQFHNNIKADEYYRQATPEERFIAHVLKTRHSQRRIDLIAEIQDEDTWNSLYQPLYFAYRYADQLCSSHSELAAQVKRFNDDYLRDEVIIKAFQEKAACFLSYLFEAYDIENVRIYDIELNEFIRSPLIINAFREALQQIDTNFQSVSARFLLEQLYLHNPQLLPTSSAVASSSTSTGTIEVASYFARTQLLNALQKDRGYILSLWKKTVELSRKTSSLESVACSSHVEPSSRKHSLASRLSYDRQCKRKRW
ncbi:hypothetical protein [Candidatus Berkiella aquae]|uniref:Uncharacterized protein n=1 Tax=Candidatus Berkiella aquae TaxID=295108 RepID=A0A0Q9YZL3_9GAMM|nr:hypothetical protein [Candidatus Berkiella aquae]MCS5712369.1 hypothetical protein [Candidatus Berkiella aquae]